ncbi:MAG: alpha/beta fold hydrolase, partial [Pseudomonadota bacterium]
MSKQDGKKEVGLTLSELLAAQTPTKLQKFASVMGEATRESQGLISDLLGSSGLSTLNASSKPDPFGASSSFARLSQSLSSKPSAVMAANMDLWRGWMDVFSKLASGDHITASKDRRFKDPEWSQNPIFEILRSSYELNTQWMMKLVDSATDMPEAERSRAKFFAKQAADAMAPTNFFATNPEVLRRMLESGGESLLDGLRQAREDIRKGGGKLTISQTDETPFEVGVNIATATGEVVFRNELIELLQFAPQRKKVFERPLLIFPPWINKFYILDLREENSMIRWLTSKGFTVFIVSWRNTDEATKNYTWDDYVTEGAFAAIDAVLEETGADTLNAVGYCIGGTLLTGALAYMAQIGEEKVNAATFFASQSDFKRAGDLLVFTQPEGARHFSGLIEDHDGIMPGSAIGETFNWLRPVDLVWRYVVDNYMLGKKPRPFDLLYWNADVTNSPGPLFKTYLFDLYGENNLSEGRFQILGREVDLADITIPAMVQ